MQKYIALFRGINVSGQKSIKMADLKKHFEDLGFSDVQTYIQSGNVVFRSGEKNPDKIRKAIEEKIALEFGFDVDVLIREPDEMKEILSKNPYADRDLDRLYVTLLSDVPTELSIEKVKAFDYSPEEFFLVGKTIYFYSPNGYGRAKMNNNFFESKLKVIATTRNWKTVQKLVEMGKEK